MDIRKKKREKSPFIILSKTLILNPSTIFKNPHVLTMLSNTGTSSTSTTIHWLHHSLQGMYNNPCFSIKISSF